MLNPVDRSNDPLNRYVGNPDIDPQYTSSLSLETSWTSTFGTLRFSPYYRRTTDDWTQIKTVDAQGVSTVTWENLASVESYGTSLTASIRPIGGISGNVSVSGSREMRNASNLSTDYSGDAMRWSARGNLSARITEKLALQAMGYYTPARDVPQGRISSSLMTHVGMRQTFLQGPRDGEPDGDGPVRPVPLVVRDARPLAHPDRPQPVERPLGGAQLLVQLRQPAARPPQRPGRGAAGGAGHPLIPIR